MGVAGHHVCHPYWAPAFAGEVKKETVADESSGSD